MATGTKKAKRKPVRELSEPEPTWGIARLFPLQGLWTEEEFFALPSNHKIEFANGYLEFLPMPTIYHQLILKFLCWELDAFVQARKLGIVVPSGYKVRVRADKYREPDILFIKAEHMSGIGKQYCKKVDLVIEVVSEENRPLDIEKKRDEYAQAGIPEYWIVDPEEATITVLVLKSKLKAYTEHGRFAKGTRATSKLLPGFSVDVTTAVTQKPELPK
jgi:Uma2 family endonuclease